MEILNIEENLFANIEFNSKQKEIMLEVSKTNLKMIYTNLSNLKFEAILNKHQY